MFAFHLGQKAKLSTASHFQPPFFLSAWLAPHLASISCHWYMVVRTVGQPLSAAGRQGRKSWSPPMGSAQFQLYTVWPIYLTAALLKLSEAMSATGQQGQAWENEKKVGQKSRKITALTSTLAQICYSGY